MAAATARSGKFPAQPQADGQQQGGKLLQGLEQGIASLGFASAVGAAGNSLSSMSA